jgi:hypothetical protein
MSNFIEFYANGGIFNHFVTIGFGVAAASLFFAWRGAGAKWLDTCGRTLLTCLGLGLLGTAFGVAEVGAAVATVPPELAAAATARGLGIAVNTLAWALFGAIPLWVLCAIARHRAA